MALTQYPWLEEAAARLDAMRERLPNAILIHGMPGVGTFELARWFAERLLCESPKADGSPCGKCPGCRMMHANGHPDCRIVVSEFLANALDLPYTPPETSSSSKKLSREIRIHQFRALTDFLTMAPSRGGRRCVLVYPADMVRAEAAASLLKSMEEPPEGCVFILAADDIDAVLPTIRSRSRLLRVGVPSKEDALAWLSAQKRLKGDPEVALAMAGGAPLNAVKDITGLTLDAKASATLRDLLARGRSLTPDSIVRGYSASMGIPAVALHLSRWCYDLLRVKSGADPHFFIREKDVLEKIAADATMKNLLSLNAAVAEMRRSAEHPLAPRQVWEGVLLVYVRALGGQVCAYRHEVGFGQVGVDDSSPCGGVPEGLLCRLLSPQILRAGGAIQSTPFIFRLPSSPRCRRALSSKPFSRRSLICGPRCPMHALESNACLPQNFMRQCAFKMSMPSSPRPASLPTFNLRD